MNATMIEMSRYSAREKWLEYSRACKTSRSKQDEALKNAYRELSKGKRVLALNQVFAETGVDHRGFPKLGLARAHWKACHFGFHAGSAVFHDGDNLWQGRGLGLLRYELRLGAIGHNITPEARNRIRIRSAVPSVPPALRPEGDLSGYFILFEPTWETAPKPDPILLKPLGEDLCLVCAVWDMTPLERSVLFGK